MTTTSKKARKLSKRPTTKKIVSLLSNSGRAGASSSRYPFPLTSDPFSSIEQIGRGLSRAKAELLRLCFGLSREEFVALLPVQKRTYEGYRSTHLLSSVTTEHLLFLRQILEEGREVFTTPSQFKEWLCALNYSLGNKTPISLMGTITGCELVRNTLFDFNHGIYI